MKVYGDTPAQVAANAAIHKGMRAATELFKKTGYEIGRKLAGTQPTLNANQIRDLMPSDVHTHDDRALGGIMVRLKREDIIAPTHTFAPSGKGKNHNRPIRIWRSLVYGK